MTELKWSEHETHWYGTYVACILVIMRKGLLMKSKQAVILTHLLFRKDYSENTFNTKVVLDIQ